MSSINCQCDHQKKALQNCITGPEFAFLTFLPLPANRFSDSGAALGPPYPSTPIFAVLQIVADFNLKINLFLSFTAILFNSYFKEKGLSRISMIIFRSAIFLL